MYTRTLGSKAVALRLSSLVFATAAVVASTGCANMATTASFQDTLSSATTITGHVHGGNQPVTGATVALYAAGNTGYGSAGTLFATTTSATDAYGSFSFTKSTTINGSTSPASGTYGCPAAGDPQMYILATGGATQGVGNGNNTAAAFIVAIGKCSTISAATFVDLNEVTSVGTLTALQQYFSPVNMSFGYPANVQAMAGFANGLTSVANLVNIAAGSANTSSTLTATPTGATAAVTVTVQPEAGKINLLANIAAACVNNTTSTASNCTTLFNNAVPPSPTVTSQPSATFVKATNVLQATYFMLTNPTSGGAAAINTLYGLPAATAPFQPAPATAPTDWTIGVRYSSASACTYGTFLAVPYALAVDTSGNVWIASGGTSTTTSNLMELTPNGTPATCALGASVASTKGLIIDGSGNVWLASNAASAPFYKYSTTAGTSTQWPVPTGSVPYAVAADASGNIFYTDATNTAVNEFISGAATTTPTAAVNVATVGSYPYFIAIDTAGRVFVTNSTTTNILYDIYPTTGTGNTNGYITASIGSATNVINPYGLAAGLNGTIWVGNSTSSSSTVSQTAYFFTPSTTTPGTAAFSTNSTQYAGGIGAPRGPFAVDGAGNAWFANSLAATGNYVTGATTSGFYAVSEFSAAGAALSPSTTATTGNNAGFQKDATIIATAPRGVAIDPTGNVWFGSNSGSGQGVFELVGAGVPVVTPIATALAFGASNLNAVVKP